MYIMKKRIVLLCFFMLLLSGCQSPEENAADGRKESTETADTDAAGKELQNGEGNEEETVPAYERDSSAGSVISVTLDEMRQMISEGQSFAIVFMKENCPYCIEFMSVFEEYAADHNVTLYEVNLSQENRSENDNTMIIQTYFPEFRTTPGVFSVKDGEEESYLNLYQLGMSEEILDSWVQEYKLDEVKE